MARTLSVLSLAIILTFTVAPALAEAQGCLDTGCSLDQICKLVGTSYVCESNPAAQNGSIQQSPSSAGSVQQSPSSGGSVQQSSGSTIENPLSSSTIEGFLTSILSLVIRVGSIAVVLMLVYVGFLFVAAQGSDSKLAEAKQMLLWTIVGALILLGANAIAAGVQATVGSL